MDLNLRQTALFDTYNVHRYGAHGGTKRELAASQPRQKDIIDIQGVGLFIEPRVAIIDAFSARDDVVETALTKEPMDGQADQIAASRAPEVKENKIVEALKLIELAGLFRPLLTQKMNGHA